MNEIENVKYCYYYDTLNHYNYRNNQVSVTFNYKAYQIHDVYECL